MILSNISKVLLASALIVLTEGCGKSGGTGTISEPSENPDVPASVAVVAGVRSNVNEISVNAAELGQRIYDCAYTYGTISLIRVDGKPEEYLKTVIEEPSVKGLSERKLEEIATGYRNEILAVFSEYGMAKYPEADTLDAIRLGADSLKSVTEGDKYLVVADSGLSTAGYLNFAANDLFGTPIEDIIAELTNNMAIPDLTGVKVIWLYAGQTAEPQERLSEVQKAKLIEIWDAVLRAGNAIDPDFRKDSASATPYTGLPDVSTVKADERTIHVEPLERVILDSSSVCFEPDEAVFKDPAKAEAEIFKVAEILLAHPDNKVYVAGCTASVPGKEEKCLELSGERAQAVVDLLKNFGVPSHQMRAVGLGSMAPWHVNDLDGNGEQIEKYAEQNRCVVVLDVLDPEFGEILAKQLG